MTFKLFLLLGLVALCISQCPVSIQDRQISFSTQRHYYPDLTSSSQNAAYRQQFSRQLNILPHIATTLINFETTTPRRIQIYISTTKVQTTGFTLNIHSSQQSKWTKVRLRYFVTSSIRYEAGFSSIGNPEIDLNGFFSLEYTPKKIDIFQKGTRVIEFVSSMEIEGFGDSDYGLKSTKIQIVNGGYKIWYQAINSKLVFLELSVIIYNENAPGYNFVSSTNEIRNFRNEHTLPVLHVQTVFAYLFGFNSFTIQINQQPNFDFTLNSDLTLVFKSSALSYLSSSYFFVQMLECGSCSGFPFAYGNRCWELCPFSTQNVEGVCLSTTCPTKLSYNGKQICPQICPDNEIFNLKYCECKPDYFRINGTCQTCPSKMSYNFFTQQCQLECPQNELYDVKTQECQCKVGLLRLSGKCVECPAGTILNSVKDICERKCPQNSQYNSQFGECTCLSGYSWNSAKTACSRIINCQQNQILSSGNCICIQNYYKIDGKCQQCPSNSYYDSSRGFCSCSFGYQLQGGLCAKVCPTNQVDINGICQCKPNYRKNSFGDCEYQQNCYDNEVKKDGQCVCIPGYIRQANNGGCIPDRRCSTNQIFLNGICSCIDNYAKNQYGKCVQVVITCNENQELIKDSCVCVEGYIRNEYGRCVIRNIQCSANETLVQGICECLPGFARNPDRRCYKIQCPLGQVYNSQIKQCVANCSPGYVWSSGNCVPSCEQGYVWNGFQCVCQGQCCPPGYIWSNLLLNCVRYVQCNNNMTWDGQKCVCQESYILNQNGYCSCPNGTHQQNGRCVSICSPGYLFVNGKCVVQCPDKKVWNGFECICKQSFAQTTNGVCVCPAGSREVNAECIPICPTGYQFVNGQCQPVCSQNQVYNGYQCVCKETYTANQIGQCVCGLGSQQKNGRCVPLCGPQYEVLNGRCVPRCTASETWNGYQCICLPNYTRNYLGNCIINCPTGTYFNNGQCVAQCRANQYYNGTQCLCKQGYFRPDINSGCVQNCGQFQKYVNGQCICEDGYRRNGSSQCIPFNCPPYLKYNNRTRQCEIMCEYPNQLSGSVCICKQGFEKVSVGSCLPICDAGYYRGDDGFCHFGCGLNEVLIAGVCKCVISYHRVDGVCRKCPVNAYQIDGNCYCTASRQPMAGNSCPETPCIDPNMIRNPLTNNCQCKSGYQWIYGSCQTPPQCPQNAYWNGVECMCNYGFIMVNGYCKDLGQYYYCPPNSYFNGVNCQCLENYYPINGQCSQCPFGTQWTGTACGQSCLNGYFYDSYLKTCLPNSYRCKQNEYWNGCVCVCKKQYYWIDKTCSTCPANSYFDGIQCRQGSSRQCTGPYQYWNNYQCVCVPGFFNVDGICVTCPERTQWNGLYCKPINGLLRSVSLQSPSPTIEVQFRKKN